MDNEKKEEKSLDSRKGFQVPVEGMLGLFALGAQGILLWKEAKRSQPGQLNSKPDNSEIKNEEE